MNLNKAILVYSMLAKLCLCNQLDYSTVISDPQIKIITKPVVDNITQFKKMLAKHKMVSNLPIYNFENNGVCKDLSESGYKSNCATLIKFCRPEDQSCAYDINLISKMQQINAYYDCYNTGTYQGYSCYSDGSEKV